MFLRTIKMMIFWSSSTDGEILPLISSILSLKFAVLCCAVLCSVACMCTWMLLCVLLCWATFGWVVFCWFVHWFVLCCVSLCLVALCCAVPCCVVLCWIVLGWLGWLGLAVCCAVLCCAVLCCAMLCCVVLWVYNMWCECKLFCFTSLNGLFLHVVLHTNHSSSWCNHWKRKLDCLCLPLLNQHTGSQMRSIKLLPTQCRTPMPKISSCQYSNTCCWSEMMSMPGEKQYLLIWCESHSGQNMWCKRVLPVQHG